MRKVDFKLSLHYILMSVHINKMYVYKNTNFNKFYTLSRSNACSVHALHITFLTHELANFVVRLQGS